MRTTLAFTIVALGCFLVAGSGCESQQPAPSKNTQIEAAHVHEHGPHGGEVFELGEEEYHAEVLHDTAEGIVTVYILDQDVEKAVPSAAEAAIIRVTFENQPKEFSLPAKPVEGEAAGQSSKFESNEKSLSLALGNEKATRELEVKIGDKVYKTNVPYYEPHAVGAAHADDHKDEAKDKDSKAD